MIGRSKRAIFNGLKQRIIQRLQGWKERYLSKAGREVLIKAVAQAIATYVMNCFRLPKIWCDEINSLIARYWWGKKGDERELMKWDKLCTPKGNGGLGFKNLYLFNFSLLAKQCWRLLTTPQSLFYRVFKARYFPSCNFLEAPLRSNPSFLWRSLLSGRDVIKKGLQWNNDNGSIARPLWSGTKSGLFSVKSTYEMLERDKRGSITGECSNMVDMRWMWQKTWKLAVPGKIKHFL